MDIQQTYQCTLAILSVGLIIASLEDLKAWPVFASDGLLSWKIGRLSFKWSRWLDWLLSDAHFKKILYLKLFSAIGLFGLTLFNLISPILLCVILCLHTSIALRSAYGLDGAYQMYFMILLALSIGSLAGIGSKISEICLWFIAGELILSYFIAGFVKLISPFWRRAYALPMIFSTRSYGHHSVYQWIHNKNGTALFLCWAILLFETFFFAILWLPPAWAYLFCILGCGFHLFNALFMGLNNFLFSFSAAYPAMLYCIQRQTPV